MGRNPIVRPRRSGTRDDKGHGDQHTHDDTFQIGTQQRPVEGRYVARTRGKIFEGTTKPPAKPQSIFKIPIKRSPLLTTPAENTATDAPPKQPHPARSPTQPTLKRPNLSDRLQATCLNLTSCPRCSDIFVLSEVDNREEPSGVTCTNCGDISQIEVSTARTRQLAILKTALKDPTVTEDKLPNVEMSSKIPPNEERGTSDTIMHDDTRPAAHASQGPITHNSTQEGATDETFKYETIDYNNTGEGQGPRWMTAALDRLEDSWSNKWARLESDLVGLKDNQEKGFASLQSEQQSLLEKLNLGFASAKEEQGRAAAKAKEEADYTREALATIGNNRVLISKDQKDHAQLLRELKEGALGEVKAKLVESLEATKKLQEQATTQYAGIPESYAQKAAKPTRDNDGNLRPVQDYLTMERKKATPRATATKTNGALVRVYLKDWRQEPVGAVKRALRQAISTWSSQAVMDDNVGNSEIGPIDIDAVRHLNQFGTPEQPIMEVACTPERADLVRNFFIASEIPIWADDLNPLLDPEVAHGDNSTSATKRHIHHFTRVLTAWWKAAHYVQNRDTADYYGKITELLVQSPNALYAWPPHVEGVIIDAPRGGEGVKENPKVSYEYESGHEHLANASQIKQVKTRSFATGGSRPTEQAQKRHRPDGPSNRPKHTREEEPSQQQPRLLSMEDIVTPAATEKSRARVLSTPTTKGSPQTGQPSMTNPLGTVSPIPIRDSPAPHLTQYYNGSRSGPNPPPPPPEEEDEFVQVSAHSGRKLNTQGPRASSRTEGVEPHC